MFQRVGPHRIRVLAAAAVLAALSVLAAPRAEAVTFADCSASVAAAVTPNDGCTELLGIVNDSAAEMNTAPGAFGRTDWQFIGRDNKESEAGDIDIWSGGDWVSGSFSFDAALVDGFSRVALVLKSAASATPCSVIAWLLEPGQTSGSFSSPFLCQAGLQQEISHLTLYGTPEPVPLPAAAPLLGGALALLGLAATRRRRAA